MLSLFVAFDCWIFSRLLFAFQRIIHHLLLANKLTKGQKDYKRKKQQGLKDARLVEREDGKKVPRITKRQLCVRVSQEAADRLSVEAEKRVLTKQEMLTWLLVQGLPKYSTHSSGYSVCDHD